MKKFNSILITILLSSIFFGCNDKITEPENNSDNINPYSFAE